MKPPPSKSGVCFDLMAFSKMLCDSFARNVTRGTQQQRWRPAGQDCMRVARDAAYDEPDITIDAAMFVDYTVKRCRFSILLAPCSLASCPAFGSPVRLPQPT